MPTKLGSSAHGPVAANPLQGASALPNLLSDETPFCTTGASQTEVMTDIDLPIRLQTTDPKLRVILVT